MSLNVYDAIMAAADHIEKNPAQFVFTKSDTPRSCGSPGCALGWIGYFGNLGRDSNEVARRLGLGEMHFYNWMGISTLHEGFWTRDASVCATGLRRFAEKHFAYLTKPVWVVMLDREAVARKAAQPAYDKFRKGLQLEHVPQGEPGNTVPSNEPIEDDEVL